MRSDPSDIPVILSFDEHLTHIGKLFISSYLLAASAAARRVVFKVGAKHLHLLFVLKAGLACPITLTEGVTVTVNGTPLARRSMNRGSNYPDDSTLSTVFTGSTVNGGTIIYTDQAGFGTVPGQANPGDANGDTHFILSPNTNYSFDFTPAAAADTVFKSIFYEEERW